MSKKISTKTYKKLTTYLSENLNANQEVTKSHTELIRAIGVSRTTLVLAVKKMRDQDDEWKVTSGGSKPGDITMYLTTYRYLGSK